MELEGGGGKRRTQGQHAKSACAQEVEGGNARACRTPRQLMDFVLAATFQH